ncbi:Mce-associated membrane protein [Herbihabitans rhizosphaerae]|uniref:Mce-associated membrane protein n=1 Tax=Herbihabitans rhizosphaerae TaxID=1872711 RepID=A0A4Q7KBG0_9PSEU|nr:nuclear transport factor 2 family protein [Herbihabitans rhizosphaerae]RZS29432.1 Mce-associated membrane protein [Herbihabitans rhizosphaerae]
MRDLLKSKGMLRASVVLVLAAVAFAGWSAWTLVRSSASPATGDRDEALAAGRRAVAVLNTMDHRGVDAGLDRWAEVATGEFRDELVRGRDESRKQLTEAKTVTSGRTVDAAVMELDAAAGTAKLIAAVEVTVTPDGGAPVVKRSRMQTTVNRVDGGWKVSAVGQVPTGLP